MRRGSTGRSDALVKSEQGEQGFWPSYADMMSAVALILFFLMLLSYTQNMITGNNLRNTQEALLSTEATLTVTQQDLLTSREDLEKTQLNLADTQNQLAQTLQQVQSAETELNRVNDDLDDARLTLARQQTALAQQEADLASQARQLADQEALIAAQDAYVQAANEELLNMHNQMQTISVLRLSIVEQIRDSVAQVMGDPSKVSISDNGSIVLGDGVFFDSGKYDILPAAQPTLDRIIDAFAAILSNEENTRYIDSIVISGYTDWDGTNWENRVLSTNRANAVLNYLLEHDNGKLDPYVQYFSAAGYGEERPVPGTDQYTEEGKAANRRIEISILLKDDSILDIVDSYLAIEMPESVTG